MSRAAGAYGRWSGARDRGSRRLVLVMLGPGATNAITGIATAYMDSIPLVVLSGRSDLCPGYDAFQECDMVGISRPVVKTKLSVKQTEDIPQVLKKAFWLAASGCPGPVVVDLPKIFWIRARNYPCGRQVYQMRSYNPTTTGHKGQIKRALQTLEWELVVYAAAITAAGAITVERNGGGVESARCSH